MSRGIDLVEHGMTEWHHVVRGTLSPSTPTAEMKWKISRRIITRQLKSVWPVFGTAVRGNMTRAPYKLLLHFFRFAEYLREARKLIV